MSIKKNFSWQLAEKILRIASGVFVTALVARHVGPSDYGYISLGMAFLTIAQAISNFGIDNLYIGKVANNKKNAQIRAAELVWIKFIFSLLSYFVFLLIIILFYDGNIIYIIIVSSVFFSMFDVFDVINNAHNNYKVSAVARIISCIFAATIKIVGVYFGFGVIFFAIANFSELFFSAIFLSILSRKIFIFNQFNIISRVPKIACIYKWYAFSIIIVAIYVRIDHVVVEKICGRDLYGVYSAVVPLVAAWAFVPVTLVSSSMSTMVEAKKTGIDNFIIEIKKLTKKLFLFGVAISAIYVLFGRYIIHYLFGESYKDGYYVICFYSFSMIFSFISNAQSPWIILQCDRKIVFIKSIIGIAISIIFTFILSKKYGIIGAAFSVMLSQALTLVIFSFIFIKKVFFCQLFSICRFWSFHE